MQKLNSVAGLKDAIQALEAKQTLKGQILKEHFYLMGESLRPANLIRSTLKDITSSPKLIDNILGAGVGMATGFIAKKILIGTSGSILRKIFGLLLQFGVTTVIARHPDKIKSTGNYIYEHLFNNRKINSSKP
jgi:hypothetical protein